MLYNFFRLLTGALLTSEIKTSEIKSTVVQTVHLRGSEINQPLENITPSQNFPYSFKENKWQHGIETVFDEDSLLANNPNRLTVTVDCGSSGSRLSLVQYDPKFNDYKVLYSFKLNKPLTYTADSLELQEDYARKLFAGLPAAIAATGISPEYIPAVIGGTAGMRQLFPTQQEQIYNTVNNVLTEMTNITNTKIGTLQGSDEGILGVAAANYLSRDEKFSIGTVDFGGSSVQVSFVTPACDAPNVYKVQYNNSDYCVYVNSSPTGNDDGRKAAMSNANCFPKEYPGYYNPKVGVSCRETTDTFYTNDALHPITEAAKIPSKAQMTYLLSTYVYAYQAATGQTGSYLPFDVEAFEKGTQAICDSTWLKTMDPYYATYCYGGNAGLSIYDESGLKKIFSDNTYVVDKVPYSSENGEIHQVSVSWAIAAGLQFWEMLKINNQTQYSESSQPRKDSCSDDDNMILFIASMVALLTGITATAAAVYVSQAKNKQSMFSCCGKKGNLNERFLNSDDFRGSELSTESRHYNKAQYTQNT